MKKVLAPLALAALVFAGCNSQTSSSKGKDGKELKLTTQKTLAVEQDGTVEVKITIDRKGFDDPVVVKFDKRPEGVTIEDGSLDKGVKERAFTLKAAPTAKAGKYTVTVDATHGDMKDHHEIALEVKEKKTSSTSGSSPLGKQAAEDLKKKRDALSAAAQVKLKEIDQSMEELRAEAKSADAKAKVEINSRLTALEEQRKKLGTEVAQIQSTSAEAWEAFSARLTNAAEQLHQGVNEAVQKFKKK
jgi:hypothetical protein